MKTRSMFELAVAGCLLVVFVPASLRADAGSKAGTAGKPELVAPAAQEQDAQSDGWGKTPITYERKKIILTGSYIPQEIRRVGRITYGAFPVTVIDQSQIQRSGASTVVGVLLSDPAIRMISRP